MDLPYVEEKKMIQEVKAELNETRAQDSELMTKAGNFIVIHQFFGRLTNVLGPKIRSYFSLGFTIRFTSLEMIMKKFCIKIQL